MSWSEEVRGNSVESPIDVLLPYVVCCNVGHETESGFRGMEGKIKGLQSLHLLPKMEWSKSSHWVSAGV